jgi:hypothetical protein
MPLCSCQFCIYLDEDEENDDEVCLQGHAPEFVLPGTMFDAIGFVRHDCEDYAEKQKGVLNEASGADKKTR